MELPDQLRCLFTATVEENNGTYLIEVPEQELQHDSLEQDTTYRVAVLPTVGDGNDHTTEAATASDTDRDDGQDPPVAEGEQRTVDIESLGEQGDGITRVERGFVVIVPDTDVGERVTIEITDVTETVAFADVVERADYYE